MSRVRENMMARIREAASQPGGMRGIDREGELGENIADDGAHKKEGEKDVQGVSSSAGRNGPGAPGAPGGEGGAVSAQDEWVEETVEHPAPDYGVDSPVIRYLLQQWSADPDKLKYLSLWLRCVIERRKVPDAFPSGLQLVGLAPEIKDGFLTLVVPLLRTGGMPVLVHSRQSPPEESPTSASGGNPGSNGSRGEGLWDLRVKVDLHAGPGPASRGGAIENAGSGKPSSRRGGGEGGETLSARV
ncbi:unnamed protein product [Scytosiphon promiscuus]